MAASVRARVVVLADRDKVEMEDEIRAHVPDMGRTQVICRTGSPMDTRDLEVASPHAARSIIILSPDEAGADAPWTLERSGGAVDRLLGGIVGFRIPVARLEGKWKLSQNHPPERRDRVIAALEAGGTPDGLAVAAMMREDRDRGPG